MAGSSWEILGLSWKNLSSSSNFSFKYFLKIAFFFKDLPKIVRLFWVLDSHEWNKLLSSPDAKNIYISFQ